MNKLINDTHQLAKQVIDICIDQEKTIVTAESMTGGLIIAELTSIPDASLVVDRSYIVYNDQAKMNVLGVSKKLLNQKSAYSFEVIESMIKGLEQRSNAKIKIVVSGIAGPKSYEDIKVGTVFIGLEFGKSIHTYKEHFKGDRQSVRYQTVQFIFKKIIDEFSKRKVKG